MRTVCSSCGAPNPVTNKFCTKCGLSLASSPAVQELPPSAPKPKPVEGKNASISGFVTLACPTCGAKLQITNNIERFACAYCGNEHIVKRAGGMVTLAPVVKELGRIQRGTDRTASELAIKRLSTEIPDLQRRLANVTSMLPQQDFAKLSRALVRMKRVSSKEYYALLGRREVDHLRFAGLIGQLSSQEVTELIQSCTTGFLFKVQLSAQVVKIVWGIYKLQRELTAKQAQLGQHRSIVDAPIVPEI
jgi:predicted RNA-binding Zn-ribbon protein involved in translation (DUF1610 family)